MNNRSGRFITFEGGEGAGKTTQIARLAGWLRERGVSVVKTREPGGTKGAEIIRELLLTGEKGRWAPMTEALLMTAARSDHVERVIKPALEQGDWVLCDRFSDSTLAYQGGAGELGLPAMRDLQRAALGDFEPDLTLILDLDVEAGAARVDSRGETKTRFDAQNRTFHEAVRAAFLDISRAEPDRCAIIDASQDVDSVQTAIQTVVQDRLTAAWGGASFD